jgi:hypothetical protein
MTEIKVSVTLNGDIDLEKIAKAIRKEIECAIVKVEIAEPEPLRVGDYAKVVDTTTINGEYRSNIEVGEIMRITEVDHTSAPYSAEKLDGSDYEWFREGTLVKATDEEVAKAKRKKAENVEAKKWSKIGRKPNEFKEGDIVRVDLPCGSPLKQGDLVEVIHASSNKISVYVTEKDWAVSVTGLITPVEARFDN